MGKKKSNNQIIGIALLVVGVGLIIWGYQSSGSFESKLSDAFSGSPSDKVMQMYIGGAVSAAVGLFMMKK